MLSFSLTGYFFIFRECRRRRPFSCTSVTQSAAFFARALGLLEPEVLALKHESRILGQWSNEEPSQFSIGQTAESTLLLSQRNHIQGWMVRESYSPALEQGTWPART